MSHTSGASPSIIITAAALVMGSPRRLGQAALAVPADAVGISFALAPVLPAANQVLTPLAWRAPARICATWPWPCPPGLRGIRHRAG